MVSLAFNVMDRNITIIFLDLHFFELYLINGKQDHAQRCFRVNLLSRHQEWPLEIRLQLEYATTLSRLLHTWFDNRSSLISCLGFRGSLRRNNTVLWYVSCALIFILILLFQNLTCTHDQPEFLRSVSSDGLSSHCGKTRKTFCQQFTSTAEKENLDGVIDSWELVNQTAVV